MAIVSTITHLSVDEFASIMSVSPYAFNQLDINKIISGPTTVDCAAWFQHSWQKGKTLAREDIAQAIQTAELALKQQLGFSVAPEWVANEKIPYPKSINQPPRLVSQWSNSQFKFKDVQTAQGRIISPGIRVDEIITSSTPLTFSDSDGDGIEDWFTTGAISTPVINESELFITFNTSDRIDSLGLDNIDRWEIRPVNIVLDTIAHTVVFSGSILLLVKPVSMLVPNPKELDPTQATTFVSTVEVNRRYTDSTSTNSQGKMFYEQIPCLEPECSTIFLEACFGERNAKKGIVTPQIKISGDSSVTSCTTCRWSPDFVSINYVNGVLREPRTNKLNSEMALIIARLATTYLPMMSCASCSETQIDYWRSLPRKDKGVSTTPRILTFEEVNTPFGPKNGALYAWKRVVELYELTVVGAFI